MKDLERLLNPKKRFLEYQDYLIDLIASSYHKSFKDLIAFRIKNAVYFFDSTPDVTYQFIREFKPNIKNLIKYYFLNKDFLYHQALAENIIHQYYYLYLKTFFHISDSYFRENIDKILELNYEVFSKISREILLDSNLTYDHKKIIIKERKKYINQCKSINLKPITDENKIEYHLSRKECFDKEVNYSISRYSFYGKKIIKMLKEMDIYQLIPLEFLAESMIFLDDCEAKTMYLKTNQDKYQCLLTFPLIDKYSSNGLDIILLHELIHVSEFDQLKKYHSYDFNDIFKEFRTQEKTLKLFSKLRGDNIHIFDQDNNDDSSFETLYDQFIPLIKPLLDDYRELIDYCAITNKISPIYKNLGRDNFDTYCELLNTLYNEITFLLDFLEEDEEIEIPLKSSYEQIDKMKAYSKRKT